MIISGVGLALTPGGAARADAVLAFTDRTAEAGLLTQHGLEHPECPVFAYPMHGGGAVGDFDNDGWPDLLHLSGGVQPDRLFINNRDGTFTDRAAE
jgi:hypothetical protein